MPCDDPQIATWMESGTPGIEAEWLPPNLALFRALAAMDAPPEIFLTIVGATDLSAAIAAVDRQIAAFEAAGITAEGDVDWETYLARVNDVAPEIVAAARGEASAAFTQESATALIRDAALIVVLWLHDSE